MKHKQEKYQSKPFKAVVYYEVLGFVLIILFLWFDEVLDLPHYVFSGIKTPINISESLFETIMILLICIFCVRVTLKLLSKVKMLEGMLPKGP